jgi:hypothetical protein
LIQVSQAQLQVQGARGKELKITSFTEIVLLVSFIIVVLIFPYGFTNISLAPCPLLLLKQAELAKVYLTLW